MVGFKGWKRVKCDAKQADLPKFVPQSERFCKPGGWGIRFEEYEYFFEFANGGLAFAGLLIASEAGAIQFNAVTPGIGGNSITIAIVGGAGGSPTIGVVGNAITFMQNAMNSGTQQQFLALLAGSAAASALVTGIGLNNPFAPMPLFPIENLSGGSSSTVPPGS